MTVLKVTLNKVQLYVPPESMINKDFLKQILIEEKKLLSLEDLKQINIPKYDELSVKNLLPKLKEDKAFMLYLPDKLPHNRLPDRAYFFNILNSVHPEYTQQLVKHAN